MFFIKTFLYFRFSSFTNVTPEWLVKTPGWGKLDEIYLTMRAVDLLDELLIHVIAKTSFKNSYFNRMAPESPAEVRKKLSKTPLLNPLSEERLEDESDEMSELENDFFSIETAKNVAIYGPADPGVSLEAMRR